MRPLIDQLTALEQTGKMYQESSKRLIEKAQEYAQLKGLVIPQNRDEALELARKIKEGLIK